MPACTKAIQKHGELLCTIPYIVLKNPKISISNPIHENKNKIQHKNSARKLDKVLITTSKNFIPKR